MDYFLVVGSGRDTAVPVGGSVRGWRGGAEMGEYENCIERTPTSSAVRGGDWGAVLLTPTILRGPVRAQLLGVRCHWRGLTN